MEKTTKMTKAVAFNMAIEALRNSADPKAPEAIAKLENELIQLAKKNSSTSGKLTAKQTANLGLGEMVVAFLRENPTQQFTISELMKKVPGLPEEITNQKLTGIFRLESVKPFFKREMVKGKAYFQYAEPTTEVED